jgi:hypothetical protein
MIEGIILIQYNRNCAIFECTPITSEVGAARSSYFRTSPIQLQRSWKDVWKIRMKQAVSRRDFLKLAGMGLGAMAFNPLDRLSLSQPPLQFPTGDLLGRVSVYPDWYYTEIKSKPTAYSTTVRRIDDDGVIEWVREVIGTDAFSVDALVAQGPSKTWVETPEGYIYAAHLQSVRNVSNPPIAAMPEGKAGFWAEVTVPYVDCIY